MPKVPYNANWLTMIQHNKLNTYYNKSIWSWNQEIT